MEVYVLTVSTTDLHEVLLVSTDLNRAQKYITDPASWEQVTPKLWYTTSYDNTVLYEISKQLVV